MVFVLDGSQTMAGWPLGKAKAAVRRALRQLRPEDTFQVIPFSSDASALGPAPIRASPENIERGLAYLDGLRASGRSQVFGGIETALEFPHDPQRFRIVTVMTDGFSGGDAQILGAVKRWLGAARIFSVGVGSSVNRHLLEGMAKAGHGAVAYLTSPDSDLDVVNRFYDTVGHPALVDITVDWGDMEVAEVFPKRIPDLFVGRPVILTGRFQGRGKSPVRVSGTAAGERRTYAVEVNTGDVEHRRKGISKIWARARIADLMDEVATAGARELASEVKRTALDHGLASAYTGFVAVDSTRRTVGGRR